MPLHFLGKVTQAVEHMNIELMPMLNRRAEFAGQMCDVPQVYKCFIHG